MAAFSLTVLALCALDNGDAWAQGAPALVRVDEVREEPLMQTAPVIGRIVSVQQGEVSARIAGPLQAYTVSVGDHVDAGDVVARLDDAMLVAQRDLAKARLVSAEANRKVSAASLTLARQELERLQRLRQSAAFNQANFEDANQRMAIAAAELQAAASQVDSANVELRLAELELTYTEIKALYDGVIIRKLSEAGAYVRAGDPVVTMIADTNLEVEVDVPFARVGGLEIGAELEVSFADGYTSAATLRAVVPDENPLTRTRAVRLTPAAGSGGRSYTPGESVTVRVPLGEARQVVTVHKDAVIPQASGAIVFVVVDGKAEPRPVILGEGVGERLEVVDGLAVGEQAVTRGNERLRPGQDLNVEGGAS